MRRSRSTASVDDPASDPRVLAAIHTNTHSRLLQLSPEILVEIAAHLRADKASLEACCLVSRSLLGPCRTQLFQTLTFNDIGIPPRNLTALACFLRARPHIGIFIRNLTLSNQVPGTSFLPVWRELLEMLQGPLIGLTTMSMRNINWRYPSPPPFDRLANVRLENLRALTFVFPPDAYAASFVSSIVSCAPHLEELHLRGGGYASTTLEPPGTTDPFPQNLNLHEFSLYSLNATVTLLSNFAQLPSLHHLRSLALTVDLARHCRELGSVLSSYGGAVRSLSLDVMQWFEDPSGTDGDWRHLSLDACTTIEQMTIYIHSRNFFLPNHDKLLIALVDHLPTKHLSELTYVVSDAIAQDEKLFANTVDWSGLQSALGRFRKLSAFGILVGTPVPGEFKPGDDRLKRWAGEHLAGLAERGVLRFE